MNKDVGDINEIIPDDTENPNESGEEASLVKNPNEDSRPSQDRRAPDCYNPDTGLSYAQKIANHNIVCQHVERNCQLEFEKHEVAVVAHSMLKLQKVFSQKFNLNKGLKEFGTKGVTGCKEELKQMHERACWRSIAVNELTRQEKQRAQEGLMLLTEKKSGKVKGRLA